MKIYLIRHGQTTGDVEDRYGGDYEDHLTEEGRGQAKALSEKLDGKGIEIIFGSPRLRAQETAEVVNRNLNVGVKTIEAIRERNHYGVLTGLTKKEAAEKYPEQVQLLNDTMNTIKGGEEYTAFVERVKKGLEEIRGSGKQTVAVITHGGPIRCIFREILKLGEIKVSDCAVVEMTVEGEKLKLEKMDGVELVG